LAKRPEVRERVREISAARATVDRRAQEKSAYDRTAAMEEADEVRRLAISKKDASTALKATELKAKLMGLMVDRQEIRTGTLDSMPADQQMRILDAIKSMLETGQVIDVTPESVTLTHQPTGEGGDREPEPDDGANTGPGLTILGGEALDTGDEDLECAEAPKS